MCPALCFELTLKYTSIMAKHRGRFSSNYLFRRPRAGHVLPGKVNFFERKEKKDG